MPDFNENPPALPLPLRPAEPMDSAITAVVENLAEKMEALGYPQMELSILVMPRLYRITVRGQSSADLEMTTVIDRGMDCLFPGDPIACAVREILGKLDQRND